MDLQFLAKADNAALQLEIAKNNFENARAQLEAAKETFDELLPLADELGIPRAKLKKLTEDRVRGLMESGMIGASASAEPKKDRAKKAKKNEQSNEAGTEVEDLNAFRVPPGEAVAEMPN